MCIAISASGEDGDAALALGRAERYTVSAIYFEACSNVVDHRVVIRRRYEVSGVSLLG
jgi:hypothetical protein